MISELRLLKELPQRLRRKTLYARIALAFALLIGPILAIEAGIGVLLYRQWQEANNDADQKQLRFEVTRRLSESLERSMADHPSESIDRLFDELPEHQRAFLILKDGRLIGAPVARRSVDLVVDDLRQLQGNNDPIIRLWERTRSTAAVLRSNGEVIGVIGLIPTTALERFGPLLSALGIGVVTVGILVSTLVIVRPVRSRLWHLQQTANQFGAGDFDARADEDGKDEVSDLAAAFNCMADELKRRTAALETSNRLRKQLVADVSHELMTPLTAVMGHLETLGMSELRLTRHERLRQVRIAAREARRLKRLIGDLLDVARLEGGMRLDVQSISTAALFRRVVEAHEHEIEPRHLEITIDIAEGANSVTGDPFRLEQCLQNLVANALRHTPDGGQIRLRATVDPTHLVLEVSDSGEGVSAEHLPYVFDRFYKAAASRSIATAGSGLGLSIVKAIAIRHGGQVEALSNVGKGFAVRVWLPHVPQLKAS